MNDDASPLQVIESLAEAINRHDLDGIMKLLHEGHVFVDSLGNKVRGPQAVRKAWQDYLAMVPDYWLRIDHGVLAPEYVALFGAAGGTLAVEGKVKEENWWETTAAWRAVVVDGRVAKWEVYADNEPIRALIRRKAPKKKSKSRAKTKPGAKSRPTKKPTKKK
ncbi:MAG TPA: nuclear transport factor 2 family protein [Steroidobacteraceae bacterium]|nr:nuclear transport factor 2 family protein [Steroidobacteraceae bacterium]